METIKLHTYKADEFEDYGDTLPAFDESLTAITSAMDNLQNVIEYLWNEGILYTDEANKADQFLIEMTKQLGGLEVYLNQHFEAYNDML